MTDDKFFKIPKFAILLKIMSLTANLAKYIKYGNPHRLTVQDVHHLLLNNGCSYVENSCIV